MNKRLVASVLTATMVLGAAANSTFAEDRRQKEEKFGVIKSWKEDTIDTSDFQMKWDKEEQVPDFIKGKLSKETVTTERKVQNYLDGHKNLFNIENSKFDVKMIEEDKLGLTHYRTEQTVNGIPVYGGEINVHIDSEGFVYAVNGEVNTFIDSKASKKDVKLSKEEAIKFAENTLDEKANKYIKEPEAKLFLYEVDGRAHLVYLVELDYIDPMWAKWRIFVDAETGKVVDSYNGAAFAQSVEGTGLTGFNQEVQINTTKDNGEYYLIDSTKPMTGVIKTCNMNYKPYVQAPGTVVSDSDNNFNSDSQKAAVSAHYYIGKVYDYYKNEYNRNSYDNKGSDIITSVHCAGKNGEKKWNNAAWIGDQFVFGDGDGTEFSNLSDAFDVVAHEFTHGFTDSTSDLEYKFQSGALNEAISDIIGVAIENEAGDWLVGEDCYTPGTSGDALRSMKNPELYNQPAHMDDYKNYTIDYDNGGVHINSGIINKAAYNIGSVVGMYKMGQIFYRANAVYYTSTSDFDDARSGAIQAAADLYGNDSDEKQAVINGFEAVGIGDSGSTGNKPYEPNNSFSEAYGSLVNEQIYEAYIETSTDDDYYYIDAKGAGDVQISLTNLAGDYDLYLYNSSNTKLATSNKSSTSNESIEYALPSAGKYYIIVTGYNGAHSKSKAYKLKAKYPTEASGSEIWHYVDQVIESDHDYSSNTNSTETYSRAGATKVGVHFTKIDTENGYDHVYIKDKDGNTVKTYTGYKTDVWAIVEGDTLFINLQSDNYVNEYGYKIDKVAYFDDSPALETIEEIIAPVTRKTEKIDRSKLKPIKVNERKPKKERIQPVIGPVKADR